LNVRAIVDTFVFDSMQVHFELHSSQRRSRMANVGIVTDTDCSLPVSITEELGVIQVPIHVHFNGESLDANVDIDDEGLFARVEDDGRLPSTSAPSPGEFSSAYQRAFDAGYDSVVCICVSGAVSATYAAAVNGSNVHPGKDITVVDSNSLSLSQGFMVLAAAQAAQAGASPSEVAAQAIDTGERSHLFASLSTLKYLAMSGRVGHLVAGVADVFDVKPILTIRDGKLDLLERVRTQKKAWDRVVELAREARGDFALEQMGIVHVAARSQAAEFEHLVRANLGYEGEILITELTPGLSVHSGAGMVGVAFTVRK
jgi:DegV family protein with EDD domain